eukprot:1455250-Rhodomonas_salina.2
MTVASATMSTSCQESVDVFHHYVASDPGRCSDHSLYSVSPCSEEALRVFPAYPEALVLVSDGGEVCQDRVQVISAYHQVGQVCFDCCLGCQEDSCYPAISYAEGHKGSPHVAVCNPGVLRYCCWLKPFPPEFLIVVGGVLGLCCLCAENLQVALQGCRFLYGSGNQVGSFWGELLC